MFGQRLKVTVCVRVCMYVKWLHVSHQEAFWDSLSFKGAGCGMAKTRRGGGRGSVSYKLIKSEEDVFVSLDTFFYI